MHALAQISFNMRHGNTPVSKEVKRNIKKHIDTLVSLVETSVASKTKKQTLAQEAKVDLLIPVLTTMVDKIPWDTCVIALIFCVFKTEF